MSQNMDIMKTSYLRGNIISWLPIEKGNSVLYFGEESDAISSKLMEMSGNVTCRQPEEITDCKEMFDYIICLGNLAKLSHEIDAKASSRIQGAANVLNLLKKLLKSNGRLILVVSNKLGLKYWAGVKEEGSNRYFAGIEKEKNIACYSKRELQQAVREAGMSEGKFYYPFPDYYFTMSLYSDLYQPRKGELIDQIGNFAEERLVYFDEIKAADVLLEEGKFKDFCNAYLVVLSNGVVPEVNRWEDEQVAFVKFSNDRGEKHNIKTYLTISNEGKKHLVKCPDSERASQQTESMVSSKEGLEKQYASSCFSINACTRRKDGVEFEFCLGHTMEEEVDKLLEDGREEEACARIMRVIKEILSAKPQKKFVVTKEFREVFGDVDLPRQLLATDVSDIDMILANILVQNDKWVLIDYEWTFSFPVPMNYILYRTLHYYVNTTAERRVLEKYNLFQKAGISEREMALYPDMEWNFQCYVLKGHIPMRELNKEAGSSAYHISSMMYVVENRDRGKLLQVYFNRGEGFLEEESVFYSSDALDGTYSVRIPFDSDVKELRVDPGSQACTVEVRFLCFRDGPQKSVSFLSNGHKIEKNLYLFDTDDPNMLFDEIPEGSRALQVDIKVESMSLEAAKQLALKIDPAYRLKKLIKNEE